MKILVTGANGFVGKNLVAELKNQDYEDIFEFSRETDPSLLDTYTKECDFVFHLAGVNRPKDQKEFMEGNYGFTSELLALLKKHNNKSPVLFTSSTQASKDNPYGRSKKAVEDLLFSYSKQMGVKTLIYRLPNLFGKWCRPNYNSVVATFCHNIARNLPIRVNDPNTEITLCYIDHVLEEFLRALEGYETSNEEICVVPKSYKLTLGELADKLNSFAENRESLIMPSLEKELDKALYSTFLSYLEEDNFSYRLKKNVDDRGWLTEFIKSKANGQIFISKTKPGITRGNHWHHTKVEKFLVIQGEANIRFRKIDCENVLDYKVNGEIPEVVDIPVGYTHSIENTGQEDVITIFWACEIFNPEKPDTYFLEV
ncbi:UDP-2-acetamido-2,6-beta-L-arabino-hexul-4-ose reductase [Neobacillus rhizosphaerae]|uniref:UDP-2-acetamido-2,6-beta-L-arabino-hexul-4-ose reductase n=1 Tax=Neobacillus rhizosphaerae TaxID=2880965 RepID=A0ABN8KMX1_9BACI|nr:capsular polysaccharide biosynthesis protein CapF [Neobacillus rhizosphaerae]CAH2714881.1 UDP-2-acetamido-2,6-beta-L-arabino-hexul-4-ose reductase [Neobacillus rhizosphaerae]